MNILPTTVCATPGLGIARSAYWFPPQTYTIAQWGAMLNQPAALIEGLRASGMREFHVATEEAPVELAWQAASRCCAGLDPASIDALIVVSTLPGSRPPAPLTVHEALRRRLGLRADCTCFTLVDMHCASLMGALQMTYRLLARHPAWQRVLIVSVDKIYEEWTRNIGQQAIQSDGAGALLVERDAALGRCEGVAVRVEPQYAQGFMKPADLQRRYMETYHVRAFGVISALLARLGWSFGEVDAFLFPGINPSPYLALLEAKGIPGSRLHGLSTNVPRHGHAHCSDFVVSLTDWLRERPAQPQRVIAYASGTTGFFCSLALSVHPEAANHAADSFAGAPPALA